MKDFKKFAEGLREYLQEYHYSCDCGVDETTKSNPYELHEQFQKELEDILEKYVDRISLNIRQNALEVRQEVLIAAYATGAASFGFFCNQANDIDIEKMKLSEEEREQLSLDDFRKYKDRLKKFSELHNIENWIPEDPYGIEDRKDIKRLLKRNKP